MKENGARAVISFKRHKGSSTKIPRAMMQVGLPLHRSPRRSSTVGQMRSLAKSKYAMQDMKQVRATIASMLHAVCGPRRRACNSRSDEYVCWGSPLSLNASNCPILLRVHHATTQKNRISNAPTRGEVPKAMPLARGRIPGKHPKRCKEYCF